PDGCEWGGGAPGGTRQHPYRLQLIMFEHVGLIGDQGGGPAPFGCFPGQDAPGLDGEGGGAVDGLAAEGGDDVGEDAADAGGVVADVDDGVARGSRSATAERMGTALPVPTWPVAMAR